MLQRHKLGFVADLQQPLNQGNPSGSPGTDDYLLGRRIATLIAEQTAANLPTTAVFSQVQDLLGADTSLLGPLRDLLARPGFRQLVAGDQQSVMLGGRDALLQDLSHTYHPTILERLAAVIDGSLGLPRGAAPSVMATAGGASAPGGTPYGAAPADPRAGGPWTGPWSQPPQAPPWSGTPPSTPYGQPPAQAPAPVSAPAPSGPAPVTALLIALVSMLTGAVLLGLGWMLLSNRPQPTSAVAPPSAPSAPPAAPAASTPAPPPTPKAPTTVTPAPVSSAWGGASDYKFGQLPGGAYPNSCAFSVTDDNGRTTTDKSQVEYWACRDVGGNPETGYRVVWADGKETNYTFQSGGAGQVVGTNGSTYPMSWRNDTHRGDPIVVINHQDGAITWIPGQIN